MAAGDCCFGCRSLGEQRRQEATAPENAKSSWKLDGLGIRLGIAILVVGQSMIFGLALNLHDDIPAQVRWFTQTLILFATLLVIALLGGPLVRAAWQELRRGRLTIEALFLLTMTGAMAASLQAHLTGRDSIYFEVVSVLLVVYTLGKVIGARSRAAAGASARAWAGQLDTCRLFDSQGRTRTVPVTDVLPGDVVEVNPGETIAVDGVIRDGVGFVSEAAVSGEPFAVVRAPATACWRGREPRRGVPIEATAKGTERRWTASSRRSRKPAPAGLAAAQADRIGRWFFPLVVCTGLGTFGYWAFFPEAGWETGLFSAMSVLLVACPCVIGLATPIVIWSALGRLAERGLIVRAGDTVERLAEIDRVMLDKTGTLTDDSFALLDIATTATGAERATLLGWLSVVQERSNHPVAKPFAKLPRPFTAGEEPQVLSLRAVPGCGVEAEIASDGKRHRVQIGTPDWAGNLTPRPPSLRGKGEKDPSSIVDSSTKGHWPHDSRFTRWRTCGRCGSWPSASAIDRERCRLPRLGPAGRGVTGDTAERALALDLPAARGGLLPDDKRAAVESGSTLFVGDGINDAAALASAHVGVSLASATDIAVSASDVTLYHIDLRVIPWAIEVSREAVRAVRRNMVRALCYNLIGMTLAACGVLHPVAAAVLMVVSSLSLIFSSTRVGVSPSYCTSEESEVPTKPIAPASRERQPSELAFAVRAVWHGVTLALQGVVFLLLLVSARELPTAPLVLGAFALAGVALAYLWNRWASIPHALDMCVGMLTLGNLGMLVGWWADNGFSALHDGGCCFCVEAMRADVMKPWMWVGMLVFANLAMLWLPRRSAARGRDHTFAMYTGGNADGTRHAAGGGAPAQFSTESMTAAVFANFAE